MVMGGTEDQEQDTEEDEAHVSEVENDEEVVGHRVLLQKAEPELDTEFLNERPEVCVNVL